MQSACELLINRNQSVSGGVKLGSISRSMVHVQMHAEGLVLKEISHCPRSNH